MFCWLDELCLWKVECRISLHYKYFNKSSLLYNTLSKDSLSAQIRSDQADLGPGSEWWALSEWGWVMSGWGVRSEGSREGQHGEISQIWAWPMKPFKLILLRTNIFGVYVSLVIFCPLLQIINENSVTLPLVTQGKCEISKFSRQDTFFSGIAIVWHQ